MNLIRCSEKCVHQHDGECDVDSVTSACAEADAPCIYYIPSETGKNRAQTLEKKPEI